MQNEITELRNQVRTLKRIVYGFGCLLVAGVVVSATSLQTVPDVIQAKKFEVVNDEGKIVVGLYANKDGGMLSIFNNESHTNGSRKTSVKLYATEDGGHLSIRNKDGQQSLQLNATDENGGQLQVFNRDGNHGAGLFAFIDGGGILITFDNKGEITSVNPAPKTSD
jgi:hypothetical protein